jgi:hypothetical protein
MKKLLLRLLLAPVDFSTAALIGSKLRIMYRGKRVYIFDFDNTLANTARLIAERQSYDYLVEELSLYESMRTFLLTRQQRGNPCVVLSARPRSDRTALIERLARDGIYVPVEVVSSHWLKAVSLAFGCIFKSTMITLIDDMMCGEETGKPDQLFFPRFILSKRVRLVTHETVLRIR